MLLCSSGTSAHSLVTKERHWLQHLDLPAAWAWRVVCGFSKGFTYTFLVSAGVGKGKFSAWGRCRYH
jgi:hypothetical protein